MADGQAHVGDCIAYLRHVASLPRPNGPPQRYGEAQSSGSGDAVPCLLIHADPSLRNAPIPADPRLREAPSPADPRLRETPSPADPRLRKATSLSRPVDPRLQKEPLPSKSADSCKVEEPPPPPWRQWRLRKSADSFIAEEPPHPPPPLSSAPQPVDQTRGSDRKHHRRITVDAVCADANCTKRCESQGCNWCAVHCPGLPRTAAVCKSHYDFPGRCTELSVRCLNKHPVQLPCRDDRCASHCMDTACDRHFGPDKPTRPSTNRTRGLRTARIDR